MDHQLFQRIWHQDWSYDSKVLHPLPKGHHLLGEARVEEASSSTQAGPKLEPKATSHDKVGKL